MIEYGEPGYLDDVGTAQLFFAALLARLGGEATITQAEIDAVAYRRLGEKSQPETNSVYFALLPDPEGH